VVVQFTADLGNYLRNETPKDGDKWKEGQAVLASHVFDRACMFTPTVASVKGLNQNCAGKLHSLQRMPLL
jgi:hypothetical protein